MIFAKEYLDKPQSFWENLLWTDETKQIKCFDNAKQKFLYRLHNEAYKEKYTLPTVKHDNAVGLLCCIWYWMP